MTASLEATFTRACLEYVKSKVSGEDWYKAKRLIGIVRYELWNGPAYYNGDDGTGDTDDELFLEEMGLLTETRALNFTAACRMIGDLLPLDTIYVDAETDAWSEQEFEGEFDVCGACDGTGSEDGDEEEECAECDGEGEYYYDPPPYYEVSVKEYILGKDLAQYV